MNAPSFWRAAAAGSVLLGVGLGFLAPPTSAGGPSHKKFTECVSVDGGGCSATLAPALTPGATLTLAFTITNASTGPTQYFGSWQMTVPDHFAVLSVAYTAAPENFAAPVYDPAAGTITGLSSGPTGSGIGNDGFLVVAVTVTVPSTAPCDTTWATVVKQSNNFSSSSGNDFVGVGASTPVAGGMHLVWTDPSDVQYDKAMSPAPQVTARDACDNVVTNFTGSTAIVNLTDADTILATGSSATAVDGVATFTNLTFSDYGVTDTLTASASGFTPARSNPFEIFQSLVTCDDITKPCSVNNLHDPDGTTFVTITADPGPEAVLTTTIKGDPDEILGTCGQPAGSSEPSTGKVVTFNVADRTKTVKMTVPKAQVLVDPNNGTPFMDICLDVPSGSEFVDKFGQTTTTGFLPDCSTLRTSTCVSDRRRHAGDEVITFVLPAGDPRSSVY